ncbi:MAG: chalcone isomerase family protein [Candidatus Omnitrophica bacterium]|nr:chalcone isomerase family protein [Candidatus Omnitrophota bacterium]
MSESRKEYRLLEKYNYKGQRLNLVGSGQKWYFFIRVFNAGFYLPPDTDACRALEDVPKRIELIYYTSLPGKRLAMETRKAMKRNSTKEQYEQFKSRIDIMDTYFVNLKAGDHFINVYIPGYGTDYIFNGEIIGHIDGADFARALFAVWVGDSPIDKGLKVKLLSL